MSEWQRNQVVRIKRPGCPLHDMVALVVGQVPVLTILVLMENGQKIYLPEWEINDGRNAD